MFDATPSLPVCPHCGEEFTRRRKDQRFCQRACQKAATNNAARGSRTVSDSADERRRQSHRSQRLKSLTDAFYGTMPIYRAAFMVALIAEARGNSEMRKWLTLRGLLRCWEYHRGTGRLHIVHCLDHFCREVYGQRLFQVLDPKTPLPAEEEVAFPSACFGPDGDFIYEDGSLKRRPCPWASRPKAQPLRPTKAAPSGYDWRKIARAMNDPGWQRYIAPKHRGDEDMPAYDCLPQEP